MKIYTAIYISLNVIAVLVAWLVPYGHDALKIIQLWPIISVLFPTPIFLRLIWMGYNKDSIIPREYKIIALVALLSFFCSAASSSIVTSSDQIYTSFIEGKVTEVYRGGHNIPRVDIVSDSGKQLSLAVSAISDLRSITVGCIAIKSANSFTVTIDDRTYQLVRH